MHKLLKSREMRGDAWMRRGETEKQRCCTYAKGEPASSLMSQPGRKDGKGWVEDSTGVVGWFDGMSRGKWVKARRCIWHGHRQQGKARAYTTIDRLVVAA